MSRYADDDSDYDDGDDVDYDDDNFVIAEITLELTL